MSDLSDHIAKTDLCRWSQAKRARLRLTKEMVRIFAVLRNTTMFPRWIYSSLRSRKVSGVAIVASAFKNQMLTLWGIKIWKNAVTNWKM